MQPRFQLQTWALFLLHFPVTHNQFLLLPILRWRGGTCSHHMPQPPDRVKKLHRSMRLDRSISGHISRSPRTVSIVAGPKHNWLSTDVSKLRMGLSQASSPVAGMPWKKDADPLKSPQPPLSKSWFRARIDITPSDTPQPYLSRCFIAKGESEDKN